MAGNVNDIVGAGKLLKDLLMTRFRGICHLRDTDQTSSRVRSSQISVKQLRIS
jgi:hypothetical protein